MKIWIDWAHRIHPPELRRLKFFCEQRTRAVTALWQEYLGKWPEKAILKPAVRIQPVIKTIEGDAFEYERSLYELSHRTEHWRWIRVYEYFKDKNTDERREKQEQTAEKYINRHHIDRMLISFKY